MGMSISAELTYGVPITEADIKTLRRKFQVGDDDDDPETSWQEGLEVFLDENYPDTLELRYHGHYEYNEFILAISRVGRSANPGDAVQIGEKELAPPNDVCDLMSCMAALGLKRKTIGETAGAWFLTCDFS
jgi:hypothetical protein